MRFAFRILTGNGQKEEYLLTKPVTYIGRMKESDLLLTDAHVSKRHAKVVVANGLIEIFDLGSANGTWVNGERVDHRFLHHHDQLKVGNTQLVVDAELNQDEGATPGLEETISDVRPGPSEQLDFTTLEAELEFHFRVITACSITRQDGRRVLLATKPDSRYPFFYPRDGACAARLFRKYALSDFAFREEAYQLLEDMAWFFRETQRQDGYWGQRYGVEGADEGIYKQEDNIAHAIATLCNYLLTAHELGKEVENLKGCLDAMNAGGRYALQHYYRNEMHLFFSTTSIHESALEQGFSCWVNCAYLYALSLVHEVCERMDVHQLIVNELYDIRTPLRNNLIELLCENGRFIRRIDAQGRADYRPDITLMSPFYFGFETKQIADVLENTMNIVKRQLWDPELGLLQRYLPFSEDPAVHLHAGNGAWIPYSAILAQYYYRQGNTKMGDMVCNLINQFRNSQGELPEHISTVDRFQEFMKKEWNTGIDFNKEFDHTILIDGLTFDKILSEAEKMYQAYLTVQEKSVYPDKDMAGGEYIQFCTPLMWSHVEYSKALLARSRQTFYARDHTEVIRRNAPL